MTFKYTDDDLSQESLIHGGDTKEMSATEQGLSGGQGCWPSRPPLWPDTVNQMGPRGLRQTPNRLRTALPGFSGPGALPAKSQRKSVCVGGPLSNISLLTHKNRNK